MMFWIAMASAAATGLLIPAISNQITPYDYPQWAVAKSASAASLVHLVIDPRGRVLLCIPLSENGNARLAAPICNILGRKRFAPATLRNGEKVHAFLDVLIKFFVPATAEGRRIMALSESPDAELFVDRLPDAIATQVRITLAYSPTGKITDCGPSVQETQLALAGAACTQRAMFDNVIKTSSARQPVAYVTEKRILFRASAKAK